MMRKGENFFLVAAILLGLFVLLGSYNVEAYVDEPLTPAIYATIVSGLLIGCSAVRLIINLRKIKAAAGKMTAKEVTMGNAKIVVLQGVMMLLYVIGMSTLGFFTTTFLYFLISLVVLSATKEKKAIIQYTIATLAFTVCLYFILDAFNIFLPNTLFI